MRDKENPPETNEKPAALSVRGMTKYYGEFPANKDIDLELKAGEIHALLGENGAGKSTLVKILFGGLQPTSGEIFIGGKSVRISSPSDARKLGIGMVFQHFSLFDALSVGENIALSLDSGASIREISSQARELSQRYNLPLNPDSIVGDLSVGERQRVEIIRCLLQDPSIIILDEPTSVLTPQEAEHLFATLDTLKGEGRSILFISHRLEEVRRLCDRATILRFGEKIAECDPKQESAASIAGMMVGSHIATVEKEREEKSLGQETLILSVDELNYKPSKPFSVALHNISLALFGGEILGVAGVAGNGQSELFDVLSGEVLSDLPETILIRDLPVGRYGINQRRKVGAGFVPEERLGHAAVGQFQLTDNMLLARHASDDVAFQWGGKLRLIWRAMVQKATSRISNVMDVRKSGENPYANALSGGNLQKFIVGRELDRQPSLLIINQPSWGVDAGAAARIRQALIDLANSGSAVLVISQDLDEIFEIADRISVMFHGKLSKSVSTRTISREQIGLMMTGSADADEVGKHAA
ncbi:MAG: ABC transporter ATP-binding protein [Pseudomonadota bacterium]